LITHTFFLTAPAEQNVNRKIERGTKGEQNGASLTGDSFHVKPENKLILFHFIAFYGFTPIETFGMVFIEVNKILKGSNHDYFYRLHRPRN